MGKESNNTACWQLVCECVCACEKEQSSSAWVGVRKHKSCPRCRNSRKEEGTHTYAHAQWRINQAKPPRAYEWFRKCAKLGQSEARTLNLLAAGGGSPRFRTQFYAWKSAWRQPRSRDCKSQHLPLDETAPLQPFLIEFWVSLCQSFIRRQATLLMLNAHLRRL